MNELKQLNEEEDAMDVEPVETIGNEFARPEMAENNTVRLFTGLKFFLSREVPRYSLEFVIKAFGGDVVLEEGVSGRPGCDPNDSSITHHICDRPSQAHRFLNRVYVQPQWVYDCVNSQMLLKSVNYIPGATLPAHLSPFVTDSAIVGEEDELDENPQRLPDIDAEGSGEDEHVDSLNEEVHVLYKNFFFLNVLH
jgi:pescadillo protein